MFNKASVGFNVIKYMWRLHKALKNKKAFDNGKTWAATTISEGNVKAVHRALDTAHAFGFDSFDRGVKEALHEYEKREQTRE